jgi:hypothetical protein
MALFPLKFNSNTLPRKNSKVQEHGIMSIQNVFKSHLLNMHRRFSGVKGIGPARLGGLVIRIRTVS